MKFYSASNKKDIWQRMRRMLYHDLDIEFDEQEMDAITKDVDNRASFIAYVEETPIGMLELSLRNFVDGCLSSPVAYLEGIFIEENARGKGYGKRMIDYALLWAKSRGCTEMATDAEIQNIDAQKFHKKVGFRETYRVVNYKMEVN